MSFWTDALHQYGLRAFENVEAPTLVAPQIVGAPGTGVCEYVVTFKTIVGETVPSQSMAISNAPNTLNDLNKVLLRVQSIPAAARYIRYFKKVGSVFRLLGEVDVSIGSMYDHGQVTTSVVPPDINTSGRPAWQMLLTHAGRYYQRMEFTDSTALQYRALKNLGDKLFKNGDITSGGAETLVTGTTWRIADLEIYLDGLFLPIPAGEITLTGVGTEVVGIVVTPKVVTYLDDPVMRNIDEGIPADKESYNREGCDRLTLDVQWVKDVEGAIAIKTFIDGQLKLKTFVTEMTELDKRLDARTYDVSGSFVVKNFGKEILPHPTDATKLQFKAYSGKAYPDGHPVETIAPQTLDVAKARDTATKNNTVSSAFISIGGSAVGTIVGPFEVNGKAMRVQCGNGGSHTVNLTGAGQTAAQVASQVVNALNTYPTAPNFLVSAIVTEDGRFQLVAANGKTLSLLPVANDAYGVLGLAAGTYQPSGQRIYQMSESFVKAVTDLSYPAIVTQQVTHNGLTQIDALPHPDVLEILGASATAADANDRKWSWVNGIDFVQNGDSIDFNQSGGSKPTAGATFYVTYRYQYTAAKGSRVLMKVTDADVVKGAPGTADNLVVTGGTCTKVIDGSVVAGLSGAVKDVREILQVSDVAGQGQSTYDSFRLLKNSDALSHNTSQIDWSAAGSPGTNPGGQPIQGAHYKISFTFWMHATEGDFVTSDSYDMYELIEKAPNGAWALRDCLDFRTGGSLPQSGENPIFDLEYYLPRIDKVGLESRTGTFYLIKGVPSKALLEPATPADGLVLFKLIIRPYTYSKDDVTIVSIEALRHTQMGIQEISEAIRELQYYEALNQLARVAKDNASAAVQETHGIFTDPLTGTGRGDVTFNKMGLEFTAAIDAERQIVKLPVAQDARELAVNLAQSTNVARVGTTLCLAFEETPYLSQLRSTECFNINPDEVFSWNGVLEIDPAMDVFTDVQQLPVVDINYDNNMAAMEQISADNAAKANKISYGSWHWASDSTTQSNQSVWDTLLQTDDTNHFGDEGQPYSNAWGSQANGIVRERQGTTTTIVPQRTLIDLGDKVIDVTALPMMRTKYPDGSSVEIHCTGLSMLPVGTFAVSIDGKQLDFVATDGYQQGVLYQGKKTVIADVAGTVKGKFVMPEGITVGKKTVQIFTPTNDSAASALFFSQGFLETRQSTVMGVVSTVERVETVTQRQLGYADPLAQTFLVTEADEPVYISSVDLYICKKDAHLPLTVEIRKTLNGYPTQEVIQSKTLMPADLNVDPLGSARTRFTFENVVAYNAGEYAVAILGNSAEYWVRVCKLGGVAIEDGQPVRSQAAGGVLFHSPNNSTWIAMSDYDLKFQINKSNFENNAQIVFDDITGVEAGLLCAKVTQFLPVGVGIKWALSLDEGQTWRPFAPLIDTELGVITTKIRLRVDVSAVGGTFMIVDKIAGILFMLHDAEANYIGANALLPDEPDKVALYLNINADGVNGAGPRTVTPYYSVDDGEKYWSELKPPAGFAPSAVGDGTFQEYEFVTAEESTITDATNTSPVVITSVGHSRTENEVMLIAGIAGNTAANRTARVKNVTPNTVELYDPDTDLPIAGNGAYTSGGTMRLAPYGKFRLRLNLKTTNRAISPEVGGIRAICGSATI